MWSGKLVLLLLCLRNYRKPSAVRWTRALMECMEPGRAGADLGQCRCARIKLDGAQEAQRYILSSPVPSLRHASFEPPPSKRLLCLPYLLPRRKKYVVADEGLRSKAFWSHEDLPWMVDFEKGFDDVRKELLALRGRGGFQVLLEPGRY